MSGARWRVGLPLAIAGTNLGALLCFVLWDWPEWWVNVNFEASPLTWFSSVQLILIGLCCALNGLLARQEATGARLWREQGWAWLGLAAGFWFLSIDERFQIHERLREGFFKPRGIGTELPGIGPGDFMLLLYAAAGVAVCTRLWRYFQSRFARGALLAAILVALTSTVMDAIDFHSMAKETLRREQFVEEILETLAQMLLFVTFSRHTLDLLAGVRLARRQATEQVSD